MESKNKKTFSSEKLNKKNTELDPEQGMIKI